MTLIVNIYADSDLIISKTAKRNEWFYYWTFDDLTFLFDSYTGCEVNGVEIEDLEGLPDKDGFHRWSFDHEGYRYELQLEIDEDDWAGQVMLPDLDPGHILR